MNSFCDLSKSQKQSLNIADLHGYAERFEINIYKKSEKSGKDIKKTKNDLIEELNTIYSTRKDTNSKTNKSIKSINSIKNSKLYFDNSHKPEVILWLPDEKDKFSDTLYMESMFDKNYIEKKYKVKCYFGSIIYYGDYYIINEKNELIHLKKMVYDDINDINDIGDKIDKTKEYIIIPRNITFFLKNSIKFFKKLNTDYFYIGSIELDPNDDYIIENTDLEKNEKINGINFNYTISVKDNKKDTSYKLEIELNYLGKNGVFNKDYPTYKFFIEKNISLIKIIDFHNKLSNNQFSYVFKKYGPPVIDNDPIWTENVLVKDIKKYNGDKANNKESIYECILYCTTYEKYYNMENINKQFESKIYINNENISIMVQNNDFLYFIKSNEFEIYTK